MDDRVIARASDAQISRVPKDQHGAVISENTFVKSRLHWGVITALSVVALLPAMEGTVVSTALPSIIEDLRGGQLYVWVVNSYFLTRYLRCSAIVI